MFAPCDKVWACLGLSANMTGEAIDPQVRRSRAPTSQSHKICGVALNSRVKYW